jgi:multiple sugar transport system substrate-binding protein
MPEAIYSMNPIALYEAMASGNEFAYCPCAYTYSNYSRPGFAENTLLFANPVWLSDERPFHTILGGTGIAVSAKCLDTSAAIEFCLFLGGSNCQAHLYGICGGQPASSSAWRDPLLNKISGGFFERTISSIETAIMRPRYPGYIALQGAAGMPIADYLRGKSTLRDVLEQLDRLYKSSSSEKSVEGV